MVNSLFSEMSPHAKGVPLPAEEVAPTLRFAQSVPLGRPRSTAFVKWGGDWHTPTKEQVEELIRKCTWTMSGSLYKVKGPNGESIEIPISGYKVGSDLYTGIGSYWTSTLSKSHSFSAYILQLSDKNINTCGCGRSVGCFIRPVQDKK